MRRPNLIILGLWLCAAITQADEGPEYDARLTDYNYPFRVHHFDFQSQRQRLHMTYMHLPPAKKDQATVVLMHGKNFASSYWKNTADYLRDRGYGVLMPDQIGFGKSSKPAHYQFTFEALAANTRALIEHLEIDRVMVMGHSMGGMLATRYALNYPDDTEKLVLVNPIGLEDYLRYVQYRDPAFFYEQEKNKTIEQVREYQREHYYDGEWSEEYEQLTEIHRGWIAGPDWDRIAWNNALTFDMIFTGPVVNEFEHLRVPTFLIIGTRDTTQPGANWKKPDVDYQLGQYDKLGEKAAQAIPNATLFELDGVGHMPQFEAFERYTETLDKIFP